MTLESSRRATLAAHAAKREAYLQARQNDKEQRKRDALRRIAPGFEPSGPVLVPVRKEILSPTEPPPRDPMDSLFDQLETLNVNSSLTSKD